MHNAADSGINDISKLQLDILVAYYSLARAPQIVCTLYRKYVNLFLCTPQIYKVYAFMNAFFPIAYRSLST